MLAASCASFDKSGVDNGKPNVADGGNPADASPAGPLLGSGLLVRYYLDDAVPGDEPAQIIDSAPNPLALAVNYAGSDAAFVQDGRNRGILWDEAGNDATVSAVAGTASKLYGGLNGSTTATLEVVLSVQSALLAGSRVIDFSEDIAQADPLFSLEVTDTNTMELDWEGINGDVPGSWSLPFGSLARFVVHLVIDTGQAQAEDRVRLYVNGALATIEDGARAEQNETISVSAAMPVFFGLGNRQTGGRGFAGTMYYAAIYSQALTVAEIEQNVAHLLISDDAATP